jgi:hypothetical protein
MKKIYILVAALVLSSSIGFAQNNVDCSASDLWLSYASWFDLPGDGGAYLDGSGWATADAKSTFDTGNNTVTLQPNFSTYDSTDAYWTHQTTFEGDKQMEISTYVEPGPSFNGVDLTFSGSAAANTIDSDYTVSFFIKALDPNNGYADAFNGSKTYPIPSSGTFSASATAGELTAGLIVQYGFTVTGPNANPANEAALGSVVIGSVFASTESLTKEDLSINVYPNPTSDFLTFSTNQTIDSYNIFNLAGQSVLTGTNESKVDVSALEKGVYLIELAQNDIKQTVKFIKN